MQKTDSFDRDLSRRSRHKRKLAANELSNCYVLIRDTEKGKKGDDSSLDETPATLKDLRTLGVLDQWLPLKSCD